MTSRASGVYRHRATHFLKGMKMSTTREEIQEKILGVLTTQRRRFNVTLAAKDAEIAALKAKLASAAATSFAVATPTKAAPVALKGVDRMAAGMKIPDGTKAAAIPTQRAATPATSRHAAISRMAAGMKIPR